MANNPFEFKYPDDIQPHDVVDLFVPVFGEYYNVPVNGHTFINGARGSGKSMMFRYMKPDCQALVNSAGQKLSNPRNIVDLDYFAIYIPIKKGHLNKTDIQLNNKHGEALLNEHYMVVQFCLYIFKEFASTNFADNKTNTKAFVDFCNNELTAQFKYAGYDKQLDFTKTKSIKEGFTAIVDILRDISSDFQHNYLKKLVSSAGVLPYNGPLLSYDTFLFEVLNAIVGLPFMPKKKPIYLLIDDADELNLIQRKILNSWVSLRTTNIISLKISTQLKYNVFRTINDSRIDTPHDYSDVNLNDIYTSKKDLYYKRVTEIVTRRLKKYGFKNSDPETFFSPDEEQEKKIKEIFNSYEQNRLTKGDSKQQAYDYAYRYAIPDFIKNLEGNRYTYSYAGFKQLVNFSSGIIREFIDFASDMYVAQVSQNNGKKVSIIESSVQNNEINKYSDRKLESDFDRYREESENKGDMDMLRNLILGMGGLFRIILHSGASERRVFSVALNDEPDDELRKILDLGVQLGYLHKSMIGNKYGTGKSRLYILNRVLAPHFKLDPTSFAGYKFMDSAILKKALFNHKTFIDMMRKNINGAKDDSQQILFPETE